MPIESIWNIVLSVVTAATAIAAIVISVVQIGKSNKQALFERRLNAYLKIKWMVSLCKEHEKISKSYLSDAEKGPIYSIDLLFVWMTNNSFLEEIQCAINHVLENEWQRKYLLKIEELKSLCEEVKLIFPNDIGHPLADFLFYYEEMLVSVYKYQVAFKSITKECKDEKLPFPQDNDLENRQRQAVAKYISGTFQRAETLFEEGVLEKASSKIKL